MQQNGRQRQQHPGRGRAAQQQQPVAAAAGSSAHASASASGSGSSSAEAAADREWLKGQLVRVLQWDPFVAEGVVAAVEGAQSPEEVEDLVEVSGGLLLPLGALLWPHLPAMWACQATPGPLQRLWVSAAAVGYLRPL
jgi:hypothetical protein